MGMDRQPTFRHLTSPDYGELKDKQHEVRKESAFFILIMLMWFAFLLQPLQDLIRHHVESFNFAVDEGLSYAVQVCP